MDDYDIFPKDDSPFAQFLEWPEKRRIEYLKKQSHWWQWPYIWLVNKWWTSIREQNRHLPGYILLESIRKGRF